jgi:hypothetical protein
VGSFLHDPPVGGVVWSSRSRIVTGARTWQCNRRLWGV